MLDDKTIQAAVARLVSAATSPSQVIKRVAMLVMHFGHPVPEMHSHDATTIKPRFVLLHPRPSASLALGFIK